MRVLGIIFIIIVVATSFGLAYRYHQTALDATGSLNNERYSRMVAEQGLEDAKTKINSLETELDRAAKKIKGVETKLEQVATINGDLKSRLEKAAEIKTNLEQRIKELENISTGQLLPNLADES